MTSAGWRCGLLPLIFGTVLGVASFIGPELLSPPSQIYEAPIFPIVRAAVEEMQLFTFLFLFCSGVILGVLLHSRLNPMCAASTVLWLPVVSIADMLIDPTSHNLFPIEFALYAIFSL